jgi:DNA-binding CsgD family transcriptional regulator
MATPRNGLQSGNQSGASQSPESASLPWVSYASHLALIMLDSDGRIVAANNTGKQMLLHGIILRSKRGFLSTDSVYGSALMGSVQRVLRTPGCDYSGFPMFLAPGRLPVSVVVRPHKNGNVAAMVAVFDPNQDLWLDKKILTLLYGMTATETTVASGLVRGMNLAEIAKTCEMAMSTARTHLKRLFQKTGARKQSDLMLILLTSSACCDQCVPASDWLPQ